MAKDTPVVFEQHRIVDLQERSDIDQHQSKGAILRQLEDRGAEDWGDGFLVEPGFVKVTRDKRTGNIIRTTPLDEIPGMVDRDDYEPVTGRTRPTPVGVDIPTREKLVDILTFRLFKYYKDLGPQPHLYNPVYDGIPDAPAGSAANLQPLPGSKLYPATPGEVFLWMKTNVVGPRAQLVNKKQGRTGHATDYALRLSR